MATIPWLIAGGTVLAIAFILCMRDLRKRGKQNAKATRDAATATALRDNIDLKERKDLARLYLAFVNVGYQLAPVSINEHGKFTGPSGTQTALIAQRLGFGTLSGLQSLDAQRMHQLILRLAEDDEFLLLVSNTVHSLNDYLDYYYSLVPNKNLQPGTRIPHEQMLTDGTVKKVIDLVAVV